jgi:UDP-GlcNAc:undecaprenyl-phosphate/decaprenyl-phosphate GlcNAc-1-phosphate transferase
VSRRGRLAQAAGTAAAAGLAAGAARAAYAALRHLPPGEAATWTRTNHRGESVTLLEGPAVTAAAVLASALAPGLPPRVRAALAAAGIGAAAFGGYDDLAGSGDRRGFRGHLGALARGEVSTGVVKIGGIGATGLVVAALAGGAATDVIINAGLTAGGANLLNLFDLRPGRAIKVAVAGGSLLAAAVPARQAGAVAGPLGAALALLPEDLGERAMLGDAGANALGAMLGVGAAVSLPRAARAALLAGIMGLTAASEVVSFTAVIERTPALRWLDLLGRRAAGGVEGGPARAVLTPVPPGSPGAGPIAGAASP